MNEYLDRAQRYANMPTGPESLVIWNDLEDDILGKLSLDQAARLFDFVMATPCQGSMVIMAMLPDNIPNAD
jgi:hypothetical protein